MRKHPRGKLPTVNRMMFGRDGAVVRFTLVDREMQSGGSCVRLLCIH